MHSTFEELLAPLAEFMEEQGTKIDEQSDSRKLFFKDFTRKLIYHFVMKIPSLQQLVTELKTSETCEVLGLLPTPYSTLREGFTRFSSKFFQQLYLHVVSNCNWLRIRALDEIGMFQVLDGSIFPTISSMTWAKYKKTKNAIRLHMSFSLNQMIPTEFIGLQANTPERDFLKSILKAGVTYIADRGYFSFELGAAICKAKAFFIMRIKKNLLINYCVDREITGFEGRNIPTCFENLKDQIIRFTSDNEQRFYRLVSFQVWDSEFKICTNRFELTTMQIIILYAYRWQVELLFKFIKRTLNGIHLLNHSPNGVNIQFYLLMLVAVLQLRFKQSVIIKANDQHYQNEKEYWENCTNIEQIPTNSGAKPDVWIQSLTKPLQYFWKIGCHWIRKLQNLIAKPFDYQVISSLAEP